MLTAWPADDHAIVVEVGRHDQSSKDVYDLLRDALGLAVAEEERAKPPCCDEAGRPPADPDVAIAIADAIEQQGPARRRRR